MKIVVNGKELTERQVQQIKDLLVMSWEVDNEESEISGEILELMKD